MTTVGAYNGSKLLIYALCEPDTGEVRYIGASTRGLLRPREHLSPSGNLDRFSPRARWCMRLFADDKKPAVRILVEVSTRVELVEAEKAAISEFREQGARLLNRSSGGHGVGSRRENRPGVPCATVGAFLERSRERLMRIAMHNFDVEERLRENEMHRLRSLMGPDEVRLHDA